jgi:hypothetical protein
MYIEMPFSDYIYTYQSTDAIRKRHLYIHISRLMQLYILTGDKGSPAGTLEKITTALKLFDHLRKRCLLSRDNILYLQTMLYHARRIDLLTILLEYGRAHGNTLHCYPEHDISRLICI